MVLAAENLTLHWLKTDLSLAPLLSSPLSSRIIDGTVVPVADPQLPNRSSKKKVYQDEAEFPFFCLVYASTSLQKKVVIFLWNVTLGIWHAPPCNELLWICVNPPLILWILLHHTPHRRGASPSNVAVHLKWLLFSLTIIHRDMSSSHFNFH